MGVSPGVTRQPYNAAVLLSSVTHWFTRKDFSDGLQILGIAYTYNMYSLGPISPQTVAMDFFSRTTTQHSMPTAWHITSGQHMSTVHVTEAPAHVTSDCAQRTCWPDKVSSSVKPRQA
jgi:hypothetical protein